MLIMKNSYMFLGLYSIGPRTPGRCQNSLMFNPLTSNCIVVCVPVATQEAEVGGPLGPRSSRPIYVT